MMCRNSKGYDMAKIYNSKFTHLSPVWYDLKRYQFLNSMCLHCVLSSGDDFLGFCLILAKGMDWFWKGDIMLIKDGSKSFDQKEMRW